MNRSISVALLATLLVSACIPSFAQGSRAGKSEIAKPERTAFARVEAFTDGSGVLVRWNMAIERSNVGFNVYRIDSGVKILVNPTIVLGSAARAQDRTTYSDTYQFFDESGAVGSRYVVASIGRDGKSYSSRVSIAQHVKDLAETTGHSSEEWLAAATSPNKNLLGREMNLHPELDQIVRESTQAADLANHRWVVSQPGVKIGVRKEGLYRVTSAQLQAAGFDTAGDSAKWRLFAEGIEQAILVGASNAYIEFYGKPIDTVESDTRVYYLIAGDVAGLRMPTKILRPIGGTSVSSTYPITAVKKERSSYVNTLHNGDAEDYFGRVISSFPSDIPFTLTGVTLTGNVDFTFKAQGYSPGTHLLRLVLNGQELQSMTWNGYAPYTGNLTLPASLLVEGANNLEVTGLNPGDFSLFDSISVKYLRRYQAEQNKISFFTPGYRRVDLTGFSTSNIRVFDITRDGVPALITGLPIQQDGATFTAKLPSSRNFVAYGVEDSAILASPSITVNSPSTYSSVPNRADLIIISHSSPDFMAAAETWANYRRDQGVTVKVVDVADIFDEFSYGSSSSLSIRAFLSHADANWQIAPKYVLLLGDGTYDPRNYEGFGYWNLVPSKTVNLLYSESPSDETLADFDNDGLAEMAIGRISARTVSTINTALSKTMTFETAPMQSLDRGAIFAYDLPNGFDFAGMSQQLRNELPGAMPAAMVDRGAANSQSTLIGEMNSGRFIANYAGHGSTGLWASSTFFGNSSVGSLTNANSPTIYTMLTCLNGYFIQPSSGSESLAENLIKAPNGGAVASWASTSETTPDIQLIMGLRFYNRVAAGTIPRIGDLIRDAKAALAGGADVRLSWALLGDPMLKVR
jgi:hypothetical protein